jgi:DNA-binding MurR/RpiR family transcriptional regulator
MPTTPLSRLRGGEGGQRDVPGEVDRQRLGEMAAVRAAVSAGATTVAITSFAASPLNRIAHDATTAGSRRLIADLEPLATRLAYMVLSESLVEAVNRRQATAPR